MDKNNANTANNINNMQISLIPCTLHALLTGLICLGLFSSPSSFADSAKGGEKCMLELDQNSAEIEWIGYKTTEKAAVQGKLKKFDIHGNLKASDLPTLLKGLTVSVDPLSVYTGVPLRDHSLLESFFKKLAQSEVKGHIVQVSEEAHTFRLSLQMNGKTHELPMGYTWEKGKKLMASGSIDLLKWDAAPLVESLNQKCYDLHKGTDGISKTWSEAGLQLSAVIHENCHAK